MKLRDYVFTIAPKAIAFEANRRGWFKPIKPLTVTFSVTAACQSRCKTCNIGNVYLANPSIAKNNLNIQEIETVFRNLGPIYFFNVSGGEPFMRPDLAEIIRLACIHLKPRLIHIPTNALSPSFIEKTVKQILAHMDQYADPSTPLTIKPSIDGIGEVHDFVRGIPGNFEKLERTITKLLALSKENRRLHVDLGTVISNYNLKHLDEIEKWVHERGVESYRHEIAEQRAEFHNLGDPITPTASIYEALTQRFKNRIRQNIQNKALLTRVTEAVRLVYYDVAVDILRKGRQVTPCYAGLSNIHINYDGEVWPCCVLGGDQSLGNLHDWDLDCTKLLCSDQARRSKQYIADGKCACPLANQWLINVLLTPQHMIKVLATFLGFIFTKPERCVDNDIELSEAMGMEKPDKALVMKKFGTIPEESEVKL